MKRTLLWVLLLAVLLLVAVPMLAADAPAAVPDHIALSWTGDPATTATVTWRTGAAVAQGMVRHMPAPTVELAGSVATEPATARPVVTDVGRHKVFSATLRGLTPGTEYLYQVGDGTTWSEVHSFVTMEADARSVKFLVFGDSQSGCPEPIYGPWARTVHQAYAANPDARFVMNMGDLVEIGASGAQWDGWFAGPQGVIDAIPDMVVEGNHETYSAVPEPAG
jgi:phosphodiesterase/alkaline phosphatase D-like protein